jgi:CRISPR-associated protein Cas2
LKYTNILCRGDDEMFVILSYDVEATRTQRFKKISERFLIHIQNSVFRGELTESQVLDLKSDISKELKQDESVFLWIIKDSQIYQEIKLGNMRYQDGNFM